MNLERIRVAWSGLARPQFEDDRGTIAVVMALSLSALLAITGSAIELSRWHQARVVTSAALDAAVIAGGRSLQISPGNPQPAIDIATMIYKANVADRAPVMSDSVHFEVDSAGETLSAAGTAAISTTFMRLAGFPKLSLVSDTGAGMARADVSPGGPGGSNLEVSVMLDVTGSMCDDGAGPCTTGTKIDALKDATRELVNTVVRDDQSHYTTRVALVPFSTRIRLGPDGDGGALTTAVTGLDPLWSGFFHYCTAGTGGGGSEAGIPWHCTAYDDRAVTDWKVLPCVTERRYIAGAVYDATDDAPGPGKWVNGHGGDRAVLSSDSSDTPISVRTGTAVTDPSDNWNYTPDGVCADIVPGNDVQPLTADKPALLSRIGSLQAFGSTGGALGTAWAWYMLSPNWNGIWTGASTPGPYADLTSYNANGAPTLRKVAVLMTDGGYNTIKGDKDQDQQLVSNHAMELCANMKAAGVEVYTVAFHLDELPAAEQLIARSTLQTCGTDIRHFYETLSPIELRQAFHSIGGHLSALRLSR